MSVDLLAIALKVCLQSKKNIKHPLFVQCAWTCVICHFLPFNCCGSHKPKTILHRLVTLSNFKCITIDGPSRNVDGMVLAMLVKGMVLNPIIVLEVVLVHLIVMVVVYD